MMGKVHGGGARVSRRHLMGLLGGGLGYSALARLLGPENAQAAAPSGTLLVGMDFVWKSIDPGRTIEASAYMINHAIYDSLVTFDGEDLKTPNPQLATGWKASPDGKTYTFTLRRNVKFSSGNAMTSADVKWSLDRVINLKANTKFLIDGIEEVLAPDPFTVVLRLSESKPSIIAILSSPSLCVLDSKLVMEHGGDAGPDAKDKDKAESYLSAHSAGTGAYTLASYTPNQELTLVRNAGHWRGASKFGRIVLRHIHEPATQQLQVERGDLDLATGIGPDQAQALGRAPGVSVKTSQIANTFYVLMNNNPQIGGAFANPKVQQAVRYALDYAGILAIAGQGAQRLASIIPNLFPGSLDPKTAVNTDREKAKALLREAGVGEARGRITYSAGGVSWGVQVDLLVQKIQTDLNAVGMKIDLNGLAHVTALQEYRDGKNQIGVWGWTADWPDPSNFLTFLPGRTVGKRAGWPADAGPEAAALAKLGVQTETEVDTRKRIGLYEQVARRIAQVGPYAPLFQPAVPYAFRSNVHGATYNSVWQVDLYPVSKAG